MKKIIRYLFILFVFILVGCQNNDTIHEERTIILNIDTGVTPNFSANFGEGEYNPQEHIYTHTISYIKDLYIYISADGYKTVTVYVGTAEMQNEVIEKNVSFNTLLDAEVLITVDNVNTLDGLELLEPLNYSNLKIIGKNSFSFIVPTRTDDYKVKFRLPNYKDFIINLDSKSITSGLAKINLTAITFNQVCINLKGTEFEYEIYNDLDYSVITSGRIYSFDKDDRNIILPNTTGFYIKTIDYHTNQEKMVHVPRDENYIVDFKSNKEYVGYCILDIDYLDNYEDYSIYLYDKHLNTLSRTNEMYGSVDNYGIILRYVNQYYYIDNLMDYFNEEKSVSNQYYFHFDNTFDSYEKVNVNMKSINLITNEENTLTLSDYFEGHLKGTKDGDTFTFIYEVVKNDVITINLYDKNDNYLTSVEYNVKENFNGKMVDGVVNIDGKNIVYKFPIVLDDLVYENGKYKELNTNIDSDRTLISIFVYDSDKYGALFPLREYDNAYLLDDDMTIILPQYFNDIAFFEVLPNKNYTLKYDNQYLNLTFNESDINNGVKYLSDKEIKIVKIRYPENYTIVINSVQNQEMLTKKDNVIYVPVTTGEVYGTISNGIIEGNFYFDASERDEFEIAPFIAINHCVLQYDCIGEIHDDQTYYFYLLQDASQFGLAVSTNYYIKETGSVINNKFVISFDRFVYNEKLNAYCCDFFECFTKIICVQVACFDEGAYPNHIVLGDYICILDSYTFKHNDVVYDLSKYSSKYLVLYCNEFGNVIIGELENPF